MKWYFSPPFLSVSSFLLLNLVRRQCYASAIGLYTRPEIISWPDVKFCAHVQCVLPRCWLQVIKPVTEKSWGRGWVVLVGRTKWQNCRGTFYSFKCDIFSKNMAITARRQLDGQHLLFGVYLQTWADLNLLNFPIKIRYGYELTSTEVSMLYLFWRHRTIIELGFRRIWRILLILEGVIHLDPRNSSYPTQPHSITANYTMLSEYGNSMRLLKIKILSTAERRNEPGRCACPYTSPKSL